MTGEAAIRAKIEAAAAGCESALDVGCGPVVSGRSKYQVPTFRYLGIDPAAAPGPGHFPALAPECLAGIGDQAFDLVYALDVIEHLERPAGEALLSEMARIARRRVVVYTPRGFRPQESDDPLQVHRSGWWPEDFLSRGFTVELRDYGVRESVEKDAAIWAEWERT